MRVLHCCLAAFYIDNYGYQENILPKMHKLQGHDVMICASTETYLENRVIGYTDAREYRNEDDIPVRRLPYWNVIPHAICKKIRVYEGLRQVLNSFKPEIIFIHDCQFISIKEIATYASQNPNTRIYVDGHTDFINSGKNWVSKNIMHRIVYRWCAQKIEPYVNKFYGTLPLRMDFYQEEYGVPKEKLDLLVLGADHTAIDFENRTNIRRNVRHQLGLTEHDFVLVSGGKIDRRKNIHNLMRAMAKVNSPDVKLIIFGAPTPEIKDEIQEFAKQENIFNIGWLSTDKIYDYLFAADLAIFPGTHSILWEQSVGIGLPCIFKRWSGMHHVDIGGNCMFLESGDTEEIVHTINLLLDDKSLYKKMGDVALEKGVKEFSYYEIAKKAIEQQ